MGYTAPEKKYLRFFVRNHEQRYVLLQGGRRSGKTFATFQWLVGSRSGKKILVACNTYDQLKNTMNDFELVTGIAIHGSKKETYFADTPNGNRFVFNHYDYRGKVQGTECDDLFINEAVEFDEATAHTLFMGVRNQIFFNFNPTGQFWGSSLVLADASNLLCTCWKDNEKHLTPMQIEEFEEIRKRAELPTATPFDKWNYEVFYKGNYSTMSGSVFGMVYTITDEEYDSLPAWESFGMDFGFARYGDPTTLIGVKIINDNLYVKEYIYEQGMGCHTIFEAVTTLLPEGTYIAGDYGGDGRERMDELIAMGLCFCNAQKTTIKSGLERMNEFRIHVTEKSLNTRREFAGMSYEEGRLKAKNGDHATDAARYATSDWLARWKGYAFEENR